MLYVIIRLNAILKTCPKCVRLSQIQVPVSCPHRDRGTSVVCHSGSCSWPRGSYRASFSMCPRNIHQIVCFFTDALANSIFVIFTFVSRYFLTGGSLLSGNFFIGKHCFSGRSCIATLLQTLVRQSCQFCPPKAMLSHGLGCMLAMLY